MLVRFTVLDLPPKKDGANSMWRKSAEVPRLKALRLAAVQAIPGIVRQSAALCLRLRIHAAVSDGDLDNFITGVCDGLMAAHNNTPITPDDWQEMPEAARPNHAIAYRDDCVITQIVAERVLFDGARPFYEVEIESLDE